MQLEAMLQELVAREAARWLASAQLVGRLASRILYILPPENEGVFSWKNGTI